MQSLMLALALVLSVLSFNASAKDQVRYVFKGTHEQTLIGNASLKQFKFGLTSVQADRIRSLTDGKVNFSDVYYVDGSADLQRTLSRHPQFSGIIKPGVLPPYLDIEADSGLQGQYWIDQLGVPEAWKYASGKDVVIADCDAGFYYNESDLQQNMLIDLRYDFGDKDTPTVVDDGGYTSHGTSVTAIIAGVLNAAGTNGIAYNSKIVPFQNFNYDEQDDLDKEEATALCVMRAINTPNVSVIVLENQMENGSSEAFVGTRDAVRLAVLSGIHVVSAAGNAGVELKEELDDTGSVIVGAIDPTDQAESWSNFGTRVTVAAYGEGLSTLSGPNGQFNDFGGTSGATPQVASAVAMIKEINPMLSPAQVRSVLQSSRTVSDLNQTVGGKINIDRAVVLAMNTAPNIMEWVQNMLFRQRLQAILNQ